MLKANTAVDVLIGPFVDDTDGKTAETGLTLNQADIKLSKNGQALAQKNDVTAAAHDSDGYYNCELDATDTNTEGTLVLIVNKTGALPVRHEFEVLAEAAYDSLFAAKDTGYMDVNVKAISEDTTAADNCELAFDGTGYGFTGCTIPTVTTLTGHTAQTGDSYARLGAPAGASVSADVAAVKTDTGNIVTDTNELQTDWANGGRLDLILDELTTQGDTNETKIDTIDGIVDAILVDTGTTLPGTLTTIAGYIDTEVAAIKAVTDNLPNSGALTDLATAAALATVDSNVDAILDDTGTNGVLLAATATSAQLVDDVWDEAITGGTHGDPTSAGKRLLELGAISITSGTAQAGSANSITLAAGAAATDDIYDGCLVVLTANTGVGQARHIVEYNGTTKVATVQKDWQVNPDATTEYQIIGDQIPDALDHGIAQGGTASSITLNANSVDSDNYYNGALVVISSGTGMHQARLITNYTGATHVADVSPNWETNPDNTSVYKVLPVGRSIVDRLEAQAKADVNAEADTALSDYGASTHAAADVKTAIEAAGSHLALIKAVTDALTVAAAAKLATSAGTMVTGTVSHDNTVATTTVFYCDDITEATADHFNGRIVIFTSGALQYQATDITDYELDAGEGKFTVTALTEAPGDDTTFIIL